METKRKWRKLSQADIIALFRQGVYTADLENGTISNGKGKPLRTYLGGKPDPNGEREDRLFYSLHYKDQRCKVAVSVCIWLAGSGIPIPAGFQVHHRDQNPRNNAWTNLFALFSLDHFKLHGNGRPTDLIEPKEGF